MSAQLDKLYTELSDLRSKERHGQNVEDAIEKILAEINRLETPVQLEPINSSQTHQDYPSSRTDFNARGDAVGNAVGDNASVEAEIIANHYNPQQFSSTTHQNVAYNSSPQTYSPHPAHAEVAAGEIVSGWFQRALHAAPQGVSIGLATILPILFFYFQKILVYSE